jgi:hypothetical protein
LPALRIETISFLTTSWNCCSVRIFPPRDIDSTRSTSRIVAGTPKSAASSVSSIFSSDPSSSPLMTTLTSVNAMSLIRFQSEGFSPSRLASLNVRPHFVRRDRERGARRKPLVNVYVNVFGNCGPPVLFYSSV